MRTFLRQRREQLGLSVDDVSDAVGLKPGDLAKAEDVSGEQRGALRWITPTLIWWGQALGLAIVLVDRPQAEAAIAASTGDPMGEREHRPYPGRDAKRTAVRRTTVRMRVTITTPV